MSHQKRILILVMVTWLMMVSISCNTAQTPIESPTPTRSQPASTPSKTPAVFKPLTEAEKAKAIQIALNTPEGKIILETWGTYSRPEFTWKVIVWDGSVIKEQQSFDYEAILPDLPASAIIYPHLRLHFGEIEPGYPEGRMLMDATVDLVNESVVGFVVGNPLKKLPVP